MGHISFQVNNAGIRKEGPTIEDREEIKVGIEN
jgi:hypothetical protein